MLCLLINLILYLHIQYIYNRNGPRPQKHQGLQKDMPTGLTHLSVFSQKLHKLGNMLFLFFLTVHRKKKYKIL